MQELAANLRKWRKQHKITQQQLAEHLTVHRTTYVRYEQGTVDPSLETLCQIADLFGCTTDALLGRT